MPVLPACPRLKTTPGPRPAFHRGLALALALFAGAGGSLTSAQEPAAGPDTPGAQVLTRGPVHEAFAGMVTFNPEPGVVVSQAPPEAIEEVPPDERPEGDNVAWIPGYWAWDDERTDFLWVSGTWRALPPGRAWMAGYWAQTPQGHQWTSGYWADAAARETTYLPAPPATLEAGPSIVAPSVDYGWSPGCWVWYRGRYAWRPGYWVQGRADWDWSPAHYVWTPRGYLFVGGFWDYPVERRGVLFAPVYFDVGVHSRRGYFYSPRIVLDLGVFSAHLFLRPRYAHYYFGDYYAPSYVHGGFYASFAFHSGRHGYDPIFAHQRWEHRRDRDWEPRVRRSYEDRRDHEGARPPRTWADPRNRNSGPADSRADRPRMAMPLRQMAERKDSPVKFQPVARTERPMLAQRGQEVQQAREQRRTLEAMAVTPTPSRPGARIAPAKVPLPRSPIVAQPGNSGARNPAPPPAQRTPKPDLKTQRGTEPANRRPGAVQSPPQPAPRQAEPPPARPTPRPSEPARRPTPVQPPPPTRPAEPSGRAPNAGRTTPQPAPRPAAPATRLTPGRAEQSPRARQMQPAPLPSPKESGSPRSPQPSVPPRPATDGQGGKEKPTSPNDRGR